MKKNNLTIKTLGYLACFSIAILLLLWIVQIKFIEIGFERYQINNIKYIAETIKNNKEDYSKSLEDIAYNNDICIQVENKFETVSYNTRNQRCLLGLNTYTIRKYKKELLESDSDYFKIYAPKTKIKSILYVVRLNGETIYLNTNLEDITSASKFLKTQLIYIVIVLIILSIIVAIFISKRINKPILEIIDNAKKLGKGDYDVEFSKSNIAELDELSDVLTVAASEMNKTEELRKDLLANVSHDLKTPLTMIKAYAEKVRDLSYKDKKKMKQDLNVIIDEADRLNYLVNDLLDLSKIEAGVNDLNIVEFDLVTEIKDILKRYEIVKETDNYIIDVKMPKEAIVNADKSKINQVIYNLINNAIEHTGDDLLVSIKVEEEKNNYVVSIKDTGKGLTDEEKTLVWNKYYKKDKKHKRNVVGSGIGLSIVKGVLESHHFEYGIDSKINEYTTFYFKIPKK